jgi:hypothetical protein
MLEIAKIANELLVQWYLLFHCLLWRGFDPPLLCPPQKTQPMPSQKKIKKEIAEVVVTFKWYTSYI